MVKYTKPHLVAAIVKELPETSPYHNLSHEEIQCLWFVAKRGNGLQLTQEGDYAFREADIEYHDRPLSWPNVSAASLKMMPDITQNKVELSRKIICPYYIFEDRKMVEEGGKTIEQFYHTIRLYDEAFTVWIDLRGNIQDYLNSAD